MYLSVVIILVIALYCFILGCLVENFTWAHPCKNICKQTEVITKHKCSRLNANNIINCVQDSHCNGVNCKNNCNLF